jgi:hypothetical protein
MDKINFGINIIEKNSHFGPCMVLEQFLVINEKKINGTIDLTALISFFDEYKLKEMEEPSVENNKEQDVFSYDQYLLTCSCGIPGCAGIGEPVLINHSSKCVQWLIPDEPVYKKIFDKREYLFDVSDYVPMLEKLSSALIDCYSNDTLGLIDKEKEQEVDRYDLEDELGGLAINLPNYFKKNFENE